MAMNKTIGEEAKERNRELVNSGDLTIEFDIGEKRDKYDRLLAYVYVNGQSVQETLVKEGLARVAYVYPPNTRYLTPYDEAQEVAKSKKIGIWSVEDYTTDSGFDSQAQPAVTQPSTSTESEFFQNCTELRVKYPRGVPSDHPAYQPKMDRDKDNFACES
jgi:micrococcal nuclease